MNKVGFNIEKMRFYAAADTEHLRTFAKSLHTWELLLKIYSLGGDPNFGITHYIDSLKTLKASRLTVRHFINERLAAGSLVEVPSTKKSRKTLNLSPKLREEFEEYLKFSQGTSKATDASGSVMSIRPISTTHNVTSITTRNDRVAT